MFYSGIKKKNYHNIKFHQVFRRKMCAILTKVCYFKNIDPSYSHNTYMLIKFIIFQFFHNVNIISYEAEITFTIETKKQTKYLLWFISLTKLLMVYRSIN